MQLSSRQPPSWPGLVDLDVVVRRSGAVGMLARAFCCILALTTPYAMFLLNGALHP
jgi:hypothetical protein